MKNGLTVQDELPGEPKNKDKQRRDLLLLGDLGFGSLHVRRRKLRTRLDLHQGSSGALRRTLAALLRAIRAAAAAVVSTALARFALLLIALRRSGGTVLGGAFDARVRDLSR